MAKEKNKRVRGDTVDKIKVTFKKPMVLAKENMTDGNIEDIRFIVGRKGVFNTSPDAMGKSKGLIDLAIKLLW